MVKFVIALMSLSVFSSLALAQPYEGSVQMADASSVWRLFFALGFLVILIPLVIFGLKRLQNLQHKFSKSEIHIVASQSLGTKEKLLLVEVQGERLLLGCTSSGITCLKTFNLNREPFSDVLKQELENEKSPSNLD